MFLHYWVIVIALPGCVIPPRFWVIEMLKSYSKLGSRLDTCMPITLPILRSILLKMPAVCGSDYRRYFFTAMCTTAFFGFLRVREITFCSRSTTVLLLNKVVRLLDNQEGNIVGFKLTFTNFKDSLDPTKYKEHSFRIEAATLAAESGFSDAQIRLLGRWRSNAFRKYIRSLGLCASNIPK